MSEPPLDRPRCRFGNLQGVIDQAAGLIGCFQIRLRRITTATLKALTCFWLPPPIRAGKSNPPAVRVVVDACGTSPAAFSAFFTSVLGVRLKVKVIFDIRDGQVAQTGLDCYNIHPVTSPERPNAPGSSKSCHKSHSAISDKPPNLRTLPVICYLIIESYWT